MRQTDRQMRQVGIIQSLALILKKKTRLLFRSGCLNREPQWRGCYNRSACVCVCVLGMVMSTERARQSANLQAPKEFKGMRVTSKAHYNNSLGAKL